MLDQRGMMAQAGSVIAPALAAQSINVPIYDKVPRKTRFPHVRVGKIDLNPMDQDDCLYTVDAHVALHVFSRNADMQVVRDITEAVWSALFESAAGAYSFDIWKQLHVPQIKLVTNFHDAETMFPHGVIEYSIKFQRQR